MMNLKIIIFSKEETYQKKKKRKVKNNINKNKLLLFNEKCLKYILYLFFLVYLIVSLYFKD